MHEAQSGGPHMLYLPHARMHMLTALFPMPSECLSSSDRHA